MGINIKDMHPMVPTIAILAIGIGGMVIAGANGNISDTIGGLIAMVGVGIGLYIAYIALNAFANHKERIRYQEGIGFFKSLWLTIEIGAFVLIIGYLILIFKG